MRGVGAVTAAGIIGALVACGGAQTVHGGPAADHTHSTSGILSRCLFLDICAGNGATVAVGERGLVGLSEDDGLTWQAAETPTDVLLCGVTMAGGDQIWAVGHDATILHSDDGGHSWVSQSVSAPEDLPLFGVWFDDTRHGLAYGAYGLFLETTNGGTTWQKRVVEEEDLHLYALAETAGGDLYMVGESGLILRSEDRGRTWETMESPYEGSLFGVVPLQAGGVLVMGLRGSLYRTDDRGGSWRRLETGTTASLLGGVQRRNGAIVVVGQAGTLLISRDGGENFVASSLNPGGDVSAVVEPSNGRLVLASERGIHTREEEREP